MKRDKQFIRMLIVVVVGVVLFWVLFNLAYIYKHIKNLLSVLSPLLLGILLALILNVPMSAIERTLFKPDKDNNYGKIKGKIKRPVSLLITIVILIAVLVTAIALVLPEMVNTVEQMSDKVPQLAEDLSDTIKGSTILQKFFNVDEWTADNITTRIRSLLDNSEVLFKTLIETMNFATTIFSGIVTFIIALFFAIYMLMQKEHLKHVLYRFTFAVFRQDIARRICAGCNLSKETFAKFITGQCIEACILGLLCCLGMEIFGFPNALEVGVLVTVTAFIPIVGAFVGAAVGAFFIMFTSFSQALWFILFIIVLQQLEDNLIYPKVVGKTVGLPSLWVLFAIMVGGSVGGILGMFIAVPLCSILYCMFGELLRYLEDRREQKDAQFIGPPKPH
ncbi:MAG: AI-2E family transporter [Ruminococcus sp.]|nr:AI-2E family transporter [Ruminococcus sp.]MBR6874622.1 AI-2E family transporter [Ruminococcus sp.]